MELLRGRQL